MRINHFLPFFVCSVILLFLYPPASLLCIAFFYHSALLLLALSFCSASALSFCNSFLPSQVCFCITFFCHTVLLLLCLSLNFMLSIFSFLLSNCFVLFPFRTANSIQSHSFSFIHTSLTIPLPLPMGNPRTSVLATETLTNSSSSVRFT